MPKRYRNIRLDQDHKNARTPFWGSNVGLYTLWRINFDQPFDHHMAMDVFYLGGTVQQSDYYDLYDEFAGDLRRTLNCNVNCEIRPLALKELDPFLKEAWPRTKFGVMIPPKHYDDRKFFSPEHVVKAIRDANEARDKFYGRTKAS